MNRVGDSDIPAKNNTVSRRVSSVRMSRGLGPLAAVIMLLAVSFALAGATLSAPRRNGDVRVQPGDNLMEIVAKNPPGTTFRFAVGLYRLQSIVPKDGDTFLGESSGAVLNGSQRLTQFSH